ncbi:hypothetical protein CVT24_008353 [Panaeolus cyanescens]|uniref:Ubiquitin carboxyl-terminal hydrolase n=1 Tax=Panaeolus cyanescens TaxID=181874 RepID=A0A409VC53_9AGAR|nr:hypothetical protein CVT24_008353 [Panaeolus cyanescens]
MLASPLPPPSISMFTTQRSSDDSAHYRPAKDLETFNSLLPPPIEFVEGSSSGALAVTEGKYEPINASPKASREEAQGVQRPKSPPATPKAKATPSKASSAKTQTSLYPGTIDLSWPETCSRGVGLFNSGNTCFLNSALQCLIHTGPLLKLLILHREDFIAKHMRRGRQEDSHEFLRYAIDALQKSCLAGYPPKLDAKIAETTWVHKLFGGRLRSRVSCGNCGHNSDTFDRILDLSLDIFKCSSLKEALKKFIAIDYLKGADKYKCEKCKKHVNAEKSFTIHEAPMVLTVHLKRFSPLGRKYTHPIQYDEELSLQPFMSAGQFGPTYSLYGVICHAGGGPNSGHYFAYVKSKEGRWWEMNDESVSGSSTPTDKRNAYVLFYIRNKGQSLEAAVRAPFASGSLTPAQRNGLAAGMKKRASKVIDSDEEEDQGEKVDSETTFIGPLLPSAQITPNGTVKSPAFDPQALSLKTKIEAAAQKKAEKALQSLNSYASDNEDDLASSPSKSMNDMDVDRKDDDNSDPPAPASSAPPPASSSPGPVPAASFYRSTQNQKKRKSPDAVEGSGKFSSTPIQARTSGYINPFGHSLNKKRLGPVTYGKKRKMGI